MKQKTVISVVEMGSKGMVLASAVANMARSGTPVEDIEKQIRICADYGMRRGLEQMGG